MPEQDDQAPATKADIQMLMEQIGKLYDANARWKQESVHETMRYFDVVVEQIRHDLEGANHDDIESIKDRVTRLEQHTGLAAA